MLQENVKLGGGKNAALDKVKGLIKAGRKALKAAIAAQSAKVQANVKAFSDSIQKIQKVPICGDVG
jgi:hypothetical protein